MRISTTNVLLGVIPIVNDGLSSDDPANVTDPDFSTSYTGTDNNKLTFIFGATSLINYIAVAGLNIKGNSDLTSFVRVTEDNTIITTSYVVRNNCVMLTFPSMSFSKLRVVINNGAGNVLPAVRFIAGGTYLQLPQGGESAGYNRQFLNRNTTTKSTLSNISAPTSVLKKKVSAKGTLSLPNMTRSFTENEWQNFLDFSSNNYFFIREQDPVNFNEGDTFYTDTTAHTSYLCFDVTGTNTAAHAQTRLLNNISLNFKVFNGL